MRSHTKTSYATRTELHLQRVRKRSCTRLPEGKLRCMVADGRDCENLPQLRTNLMVQQQMLACAETCSGPIKIWQYGSRYLHLRTPAQTPYKSGRIVANSRDCENLPQLCTNLMIQWQMSARAETCSGPIQMWWYSGKNLHLWTPAQAAYKFGRIVSCCSYNTIFLSNKQNQVRMYEIGKLLLQLLLPQYDFLKRKNKIRSGCIRWKRSTCSYCSHNMNFLSKKAKSGKNV